MKIYQLVHPRIIWSEIDNKYEMLDRGEIVLLLGRYDPFFCVFTCSFGVRYIEDDWSSMVEI